MRPRVSFLPENDRGRDFIIGDLHGCIEDLYTLLDRVSFDHTCGDRLFSTGDLVDRGEESLACLQLLREPWFHAVMGNHEQMLLDAMNEPEGPAALFHLSNGGQWARALIERHDDELWQLAAWIATLPHVMVVGGASTRRFNLVHAHLLRSPDPLSLYTDHDLDGENFGDDEYAVERLTWSRTLAADAGRAALDDADPEFWPDLSLTYCGHNPVPHPVTVASHCFVDTGAGYSGQVWVGERNSGVPMRLTMLERQPEGGHIVRVARSFSP